ncbi:hypothetical protein RRG08_042151 [Elysia crispata]|uniref:AIG1-type G domain-containing protein n=1 Tax=Elysia crispata TaxID=231223 RepID=A0AAE1A8U0_9GAST|nr:hypothetical protein RRG08_042151 [Elysia crispata]
MSYADLDIMLLGKTGVGKSRTGNVLLGRDAFRSVATMESVTIKSQKEITILEDGRKLCVVDTPGVVDTRETEEEGKQLFIDAIKAAVLLNPAGYHALIMVLRFGSRFTHEDLNTLQFLKDVFGEKFIKEYCIVVLSNGDNFKRAREEKEIDVPFKEWCKKQGGHFKTIFQEVQERVALFNNVGSPEEKSEQRRQLVAMVDKLGGRRYINPIFKSAMDELEKLRSEKKIPEMAENVQNEISLILYQKDRIKSNLSIDKQLHAMTNLMDRVGSLLGKIDPEENETTELGKLRQLVTDVQLQVELELTQLRLTKDLKEKRPESDEALKTVKLMELELKRITIETEQNNSALIERYQVVRDENNRLWASMILPTLGAILTVGLFVWSKFR